MTNRPPNVPDTASLIQNPWMFEEQWSTGEWNAAGKKIGLWRWWYPDGTPSSEATFDPDGKLRTTTHFHPNGELAMQSDRDAGTEVCVRSSDPSHRNHGRGLYDKKAWRAERIPHSMPVAFKLYDRDGKHLNPVLEPSILLSQAPALDRAAIRRHLHSTSDVLNVTGADLIARLNHRLPLGRLERLFEDYLEDLEDGDKVLWHSGDLHVDDLCDWEALGVRVLVVDGNLTVHRSVETSDDAFTVLVVTGNLVASDVTTAGILLVGGDLQVTRCLFGDYNHGMARVDGDVTADFFFPGDHTFTVGGIASFRIAFGDTSRLDMDGAEAAMTCNSTKTSALLKHLHPDALQHVDQTVKTHLRKPCPSGFWRYVDIDSFIERAMCGNPLFAPETA